MIFPSGYVSSVFKPINFQQSFFETHLKEVEIKKYVTYQAKHIARMYKKYKACHKQKKK
jgi:hypothetical protein